MQKISIGLALGFVLVAILVSAQEEPIDSSIFKGPSPYEYILLDTTPQPEKLVINPLLA